MLDLDIQELASLTTGGGDLENFERLFSKLKEMKGKDPGMPHVLSRHASCAIPPYLTCSRARAPVVYVVGSHFVMARLDSELWAWEI